MRGRVCGSRRPSSRFSASGGEESSGSGSGLGLAIVRAIAERHGGRVYVRGSRFTIELPALREISGSVGTTGADEPEKGSS